MRPEQEGDSGSAHRIMSTTGTYCFVNGHTGMWKCCLLQEDKKKLMPSRKCKTQETHLDFVLKNPKPQDKGELPAVGRVCRTLLNCRGGEETHHTDCHTGPNERSPFISGSRRAKTHIGVLLRLRPAQKPFLVEVINSDSWH